MLASIVSRSLRFLVVAGLIYVMGDTAKLFIEKYLNVLSIAFVALLLIGFWAIGKGARRAGSVGVAEDDI